MNPWLKNLLGHITLPWMSYSIVPDHLGKSRFSYTQNALSSKRRLWTPTEGHTTAAQGDHGYDVRTLEADKPAVAGSAPLIWMFSKPSNADLNSRLWRCSARIPCCFHVRFIHHLSTRSVPLSQRWLSSLLLCVRFSHSVHLELSSHFTFSSLLRPRLNSFLSSGFAIRPNFSGLMYFNFLLTLSEVM